MDSSNKSKTMFKCLKCEKSFADAAHLKRHQSRKTTCEPIKVAAAVPGPAGNNICKYCLREFTTKTNMYRHMRKNCNIANTDEGMDKLMNLTLQRQNAELAARVDNLTSLVEKIVAGNSIENSLILSGPTIIANVTNNITINAWDGDQRILTDVIKLSSSFTDNAMLKEYLHLNDYDKSSAVVAPPYVDVLLVDQVKRAHADDPAFRNVYLNPNRGDQGMVFMKVGRWEVLPITEVIRNLFDGLMANIKEITYSKDEKNHLPGDLQNALAILNMVYKDEPEEYAKRSKAAIIAHLANMESIINKIK